MWWLLFSPSLSLSSLAVPLAFIDDQHRKFANMAHSIPRNGWKTIWIRLSMHKWPFECQISNTESEWRQWEKWRKKWAARATAVTGNYFLHFPHKLLALKPSTSSKICVRTSIVIGILDVCVLHGRAELVKIKLMVNRMRRATKNKNPFY